VYRWWVFPKSIPWLEKGTCHGRFSKINDFDQALKDISVKLLTVKGVF